MNCKLMIIGASGYGKPCANIESCMYCWTTIEFLDDDVNEKKILSFDVI